MNIVINNVDFWDSFSAMKYWAPPKTYDRTKWHKEVKDYILSGVYMGARKVDGIWAMIIKDEKGEFHLRSRTENVNGTYADKAEWIPTILNDLKNLPKGTVLLGEIYKYGDEGSRKATSILNCLKDKSLERQSKTPLHFYCFDCLAFNKKILIDKGLEERVNLLYEKVKPIVTNNYTEIAEYFDEEKLWNMVGDYLAAGYEGMVIQKKSAPYTCGKRTAKLSIKIKREVEETIDAFVDGNYKESTVEYNGKMIDTWTYWMNTKTGEKFNKNMYKEYVNGEPIIAITKGFYNGWASAISFSVMKGNDPVHICWISGIDESIKEKIVTNPKELIGKVAALNCMEVECIEGEYSLRHPRIDRWREGKAYTDCEWSQIAKD